uniref:Uncharacterized protein n=1 Tax=Vespula pensylvanica TaxID=30213 RepID=A0A834U406_VESPE|nr:hypothetical protein H0235_012148 [Vespula pensylvanica]
MTSIRANGTNQADWPSGIYISAGEGRLRLPPGDSERMLKPSIDVTHRGVHGAVQIPERRRLRNESRRIKVIVTLDVAKQQMPDPSQLSRMPKLVEFYEAFSEA